MSIAGSLSAAAKQKQVLNIRYYKTRDISAFHEDYPQHADGAYHLCTVPANPIKFEGSLKNIKEHFTEQYLDLPIDMIRTAIREDIRKSAGIAK